MSTSYLDKNVHRRLELESDILNALCASYRLAGAGRGAPCQ